MAVLKLPIPLESASTPQAVLLAPAAVALAPVCASAPVALPPQTNCACAGGALEPNAMRKHAARSAMQCPCWCCLILPPMCGRLAPETPARNIPRCSGPQWAEGVGAYFYVQQCCICATYMLPGRTR